MQNEYDYHAMNICKQPPLGVYFFNRPTLTVARELLGCYLVVNNHEKKPPKYAYRIVETEAYTQDDPACHAYNKTGKKPTGRAANLYKAPGTSYVYLIYGMYHCLNVVTEAEGTGAAVLFRALEPVDINENSLATPKKSDIKTNGPGKLCKALNITREENNIMMTDINSTIYIVQSNKIPKNQIIQTTRIGISKAMDYPWRFYIKDNPYVSKCIPKK